MKLLFEHITYSNRVPVELNKGLFLNIATTRTQNYWYDTYPLHITPLTRNKFSIVLIHRTPKVTTQTLTGLLGTKCSAQGGRALGTKLFLEENFFAANSHTISIWFDFLHNVAATKFFCKEKDFQKNSPVHMKRFFSATCSSNMLLQLVAEFVPTLWHVFSD